MKTSENMGQDCDDPEPAFGGYIQMEYSDTSANEDNSFQNHIH